MQLKKYSLIKFIAMLLCSTVLLALSFNAVPKKTFATSSEVDILETARLVSVDKDYVLFVTAFDLVAANEKGVDALVYIVNGVEYSTNVYYSGLSVKTDKSDPSKTKTYTAEDIYGVSYKDYKLIVLEVENDKTATCSYEVSVALKSGSTIIAEGDTLWTTVSVEPTIIVKSTEAKIGDSSVDVSIIIKNNPGIAGITISVAYDEALTIKATDFGDDFVWETKSPLTGNLGKLKTKNPLTISAMNSDDNVYDDGVFVTLTFDIDEDITDPTDLDITVSFKASNIFDIDEENVSFGKVDGVVKIK